MVYLDYDPADDIYEKECCECGSTGHQCSECPVFFTPIELITFPILDPSSPLDSEFPIPYEKECGS